MSRSLILFLLLSFAGAAWSGGVSVPNTLQSGTPALAADVNANFQALVDAVNAQQAVIEQLQSDLAKQKYVNINTMKNAAFNEANPPIGGPISFDASLVVPPDYTPGTDLTLVLNLFKLDFSPAASCAITLATNYLYSMRPSTGDTVVSTFSTDDGTVGFDAVFRDIASVEFTMSGAFEPGDSLTFGVFPDFFGCTFGDVGTHSAVVYYE